MSKDYKIVNLPTSNKMNLRNKKFLVTGGAGFIGSHTVDALVKKGARVIVIDNLSTGRKENLNSKTKFYELDCADPKLAEIFTKEKPDYVYHFAFNVLVPKSVDDPIMDAQSIIASLNVIKNAYQAKVKKIIFSSSSFVYGNAKIRPTDENQPIIPVSPYAISKYAVEEYLRYYNQTFGLPYVIFRYASVYGPRQVKGAMADYILQLKSGGQADIWGDGKKTRDYVFVEDVVRANLKALAVLDNFKNPLFNLGTAVETTLNAVYREIAGILKKEARPIYHLARLAEQELQALDFSEAEKYLGWSPKVNLLKGLKKTIGVFRK